MSYDVRGSYFESCNCKAICPCRMIGDVKGGRSTYGICFGVLSWLIERGEVGGVDVSGLAAALSCRYDDDEPGSPWTIVLHVDERGDDAQRRALEELLLGRVDGGHATVLPWVSKASHLVDVRPGAIELTVDGAGRRLRVADAVELRATRPVETAERVACGIPGYESAGAELYADSFVVDDDPFRWELEGNCAFATEFAWSSEA